MARVLAWIVAVERHTPSAAVPSPIDFAVPVSERALQWAEWLAARGADLLLNVSVPDGSAQRRRLDAIAQRALNQPRAHEATAAALHDALARVLQPPVADVLLLLWIGHGVM